MLILEGDITREGGAALAADPVALGGEEEGAEEAAEDEGNPDEEDDG